jgi:Kef-type K+ transport system membrane component KefB
MNSDVLLALFGGVVLVLGLLSRLLRRNALSPVLLVLVLGALVGPDALGWVQLTDHLTRTQLLEELARLRERFETAVTSPRCGPAAGTWS